MIQRGKHYSGFYPVNEKTGTKTQFGCAGGLTESTAGGMQSKGDIRERSFGSHKCEIWCRGSRRAKKEEIRINASSCPPIHTPAYTGHKSVQPTRGLALKSGCLDRTCL